MHIYQNVEEKTIKLYFIVLVRNILIYIESWGFIPSRMAAYSLNLFHQADTSNNFILQLEVNQFFYNMIAGQKVSMVEHLLR